MVRDTSTGQSEGTKCQFSGTLGRGTSEICLMQAGSSLSDTRTGTPHQGLGHPRLPDFPPVSGLVPFIGGEVEMLVQIQ